MVTERALAIDVDTDLDHGGRWTSLRAGGREWLWHRADPARARVRPGDDFVDAGGVEECVPSVRGRPDHGDAWSRPWRRDADGDVVDTPDFSLRRTIRRGPTALRAGYRLTARPGYRFVWAAHALLDLSPHAVLTAPEGRPTRLFAESATIIGVPWPAGATYVTGRWPAPYGVRFDVLGPDDGTAVGAVIVDCADVTVVDGADTLSFALRADRPVPVSVALWRNLGGFPAPAPYRSVGVEPMVGSVFDLAHAHAGDAAVVPASGELHWELTITATGGTAP